MPTQKKAQLWERDEFDWYVEPRSTTVSLLGVEQFDGVIWDPSCGAGNIVETCLEHGHTAYGTDIVTRRTDKPVWFCGELDFIAFDQDVKIANVVCNPPYYRARGTEKYVENALKIVQRKLAIFVDVRFLASQRRAKGLYTASPPSRVWVLAKRPSCPPGAYLAAGNEAEDGTADWCWIVWDKQDVSGETKLGWIK